MSQIVFSFIECPCCAGHDVISREAADWLAARIDAALPNPSAGYALETELYNIRNAIYNSRAREPEPIDPLLE